MQIWCHFRKTSIALHYSYVCKQG